MDDIIKNVVRCLKKFYDVIPPEELYQEAWLWALENYKQADKFESSLFNHLKYLIRKEIRRRNIEIPLDEVKEIDDE